MVRALHGYDDDDDDGRLVSAADAGSESGARRSK
jgi:hypothetical protein